MLVKKFRIYPFLRDYMAKEDILVAHEDAEHQLVFVGYSETRGALRK